MCRRIAHHGSNEIFNFASISRSNFGFNTCSERKTGGWLVPDRAAAKKSGA
jgi:hypothetical protein